MTMTALCPFFFLLFYVQNNNSKQQNNLDVQALIFFYKQKLSISVS